MDEMPKPGSKQENYENLTHCVLLREVIVEDLPVFYDHQADPQANQMAGFPARERDAFMAHWVKILANPDIDKKTILYDGQVAGNIVSFTMEGEREAGYWIGKEYWGKGIATQALSQFLKIVKVRPIFAHVVKHNIGSQRVLEKCGFSFLRQNSEELVLIKTVL